jgi:hypothetical protein
MENIIIPTLWKELFDGIKAKRVLLAGGAVRDLYCNHAPKDLDYFIDASDEITLTSIWYYKPWTSDGFDYEGMKYVKGVQSTLINGMPINLIFCDTWSDDLTFLKSFDFGINQIGFDGTNIIATPEFHWDCKHRLFTLHHGDRYNRSVERFNRINLRYGWEMVLADGVKPNQEAPF